MAHAEARGPHQALDGALVRRKGWPGHCAGIRLANDASDQTLEGNLSSKNDDWPGSEQVTKRSTLAGLPCSAVCCSTHDTFAIATTAHCIEFLAVTGVEGDAEAKEQN